MDKHPSGQLVGITGTPGTGKKTIAPLVASRLNLPSFSLNELAISCGLAVRGNAESDVDVDTLRRRLLEVLVGPALVYGHLLPHVLEKRSVAKVVVLRCNPSILKKRLLARGYPSKKALENVEAELIGVVSADTLKMFGAEKTAEFNTTQSDPVRASAKVAAMVSGRGGVFQAIDWMRAYDSSPKLRSLLSLPATRSARTRRRTGPWGREKSRWRCARDYGRIMETAEGSLQ